VRVCLVSPTPPGAEPDDVAGRRALALAGREGVELTVALTEAPPERGAVTFDDVLGERFDVALAAHWLGTVRLAEVAAPRRALLADHLAHERMGAWQADRIAARLAYDLPLALVAVGRELAVVLRAERPDADVAEVPAATPDEAALGPVAGTPPARDPGAPVRVLALALREADPGAGWADAALARVTGPHEARTLPLGAPAPARAEAYAWADVVLHLSPVDGVLERPLEAARAGAAAIVVPSTGAGELVAHGGSGLVAEPDDVDGVARAVDLLAADRELLGRLRAGALAAASVRPSAADAAAALQEALEGLPERPGDGWPARLMGDAVAGVALYAQELHVLGARLRELEADPAVAVGRRLRTVAEDPRLARVRRVAGPVAHRARRRLGPGGSGA
jgi:hypothetical protein